MTKKLLKAYIDARDLGAYAQNIFWRFIAKVNFLEHHGVII